MLSYESYKKEINDISVSYLSLHRPNTYSRPVGMGHVADIGYDMKKVMITSNNLHIITTQIILHLSRI